VAILIARYLPLELLAAGVLLLLLTGRPLFTSGALSARQSRFRSLVAASPVLDVLILISAVGKPFLERLQGNDWHSELLGPTPLLVVVMVISVSIFAMIGAVLFYFYRAIQNINFFEGRRIRAPYSALFMIVPIANLVVTPYIQYFAYQRSRAFAEPQTASALRAALLVGLAFGSVVISVICGYAGKEVVEPAMYDSASLMVIGALTGLAGGILTTRIVDGIARDPEGYALHIGALSEGVRVGKPENRRPEGLRSAAAVGLLFLAALAAIFPAHASHIVRTGLGLIAGA
jgi:hypothetical protein